MSKHFDIVVAGATAAGYVAALAAARQGHQVVVVDGPSSRTESPLADWLPADLLPACPPLKAVKAQAFSAAFKAVTFHSWNLALQATHRQSGAAGYLLRSGQLLKALSNAARQAGVKQVRMEQAPHLELHETSVVLSGGAASAEGSLLLIAQGSPEEMTAELALPGRTVPPANVSVCGLDVPIPSPRKSPLDEALHVIASGGDRMGMFFVAGKVLHVRIMSTSRQPVDVESLSVLMGALQQHKLVPAKLDLSKATAAIWRPPGGLALELESHLAKRTLLVGTAGGFASAMTGQTLDPSIRSAMVAVDVASRALASKRPQEVLADYKSQWRDQLADRIRPTGISLQMLMPVVLTNKAMTARFAKAFMFGKSI